MTTTNHTWKFFRAGGFDQVKITSGADIANLDQLNQKLWVALACPTTGLEFDAKTLALIDTDKDGRVRVPEIIAACKWACASLNNPDELLKGAAELPLASIKDPALLASAKQILGNLGKANASAITLADTIDTAKIFAATNFNGDGIIPVDSATDDESKAVINDIIACLGSETDRSGKPGISQAKLDQFFADATAYAAWHARGDATVLPFGENTANAAAVVRAIKPKVDDYFARCRLAAFDARALGALNRQETEYLNLAAKDLSITASEVAGFPLARIEPGKPLPLAGGINPAWESAVTAIAGLFPGKTAITEAEWVALTGKLSAYEVWTAGKAGGSVEKLGIQRIKAILAGKAKDTITGLIAKDKALEPEANSIANVERLVRYYRDLYLLLTNFVNFADFYNRGEPAIFQTGTLYLDQRSCELTLPVEDAGKHATMAGMAGAYLAYCDCVRKATGEKRQIVAAFTNGDSDNLMVGRNGLFYDRRGRDWDATITKIIDNPISIRQAFWAPYKKFVRLIEEQVAKRAAAAEAASDSKMAAAATATAQADKAKPEPKKVDVGAVAAMGVAFGAIGTALAYVLGIFKGMAIWQLPLIIAAIMLLISTPSMILAYIKLRKRNLGPILDANGWAVNARAKINVPFGAALTGIAKLPEGSQRDLVDPYAESKKGRNRLIVIVVLLAIISSMWYFGCIEHYWPNALPKSGYILRKEDRLEKERLKKLETEKPAAAPLSQ
ncbi:MAG: hypothetical protein PCFJNLEI_04014 [Verrucomicrobiae bacterium]|nr:hypothetical protein [Verrucomicrobiae bacterium]